MLNYAPQVIFNCSPNGAWKHRVQATIICCRFSRHKLPAMWSSFQWFIIPTEMCENQFLLRFTLFLQTCSKTGRLVLAVNCVNHHIYPGALLNLNWEPVNISLRQSLCDVLRQLEGSFSSVVLCHWRSAQSSDQDQHRALQTSERQGWDSEEWPWKGTALPVWKSFFFPLFCQQAGRGGPKEAVSPVHLVLHQFINSKIKMGKGSDAGQGSANPTCGCSLLLTRAPPKHS